MTKLILLSLMFISVISESFGNECTREADSTPEITHCKTMIGNYPLPVHLYIPENLEVNKKLQLLVHFHGYNIKGHNHFAKEYGDYGEFLLEANANAVLAIPESIGHCTSYNTYFSNRNNTSLFFEQLEKTILNMTTAQIANISLSGHSGAYVTLNRLIGYANTYESHLNAVNALSLFDATYAPIPEIVQWLKNKIAQKQQFIFYDAYVAGSKATAKKGTLTLKKQFKELSLNGKIFFVPIVGDDSESLLDQHFYILKRGSLTNFWKLTPQ